MKHTKRTLVSLLLVFAMLATCLVAFSVTSSAAIATELPTSWGAELPEGAVAWGQKIGAIDMTTASKSLKGTGEDESAWGTKENPYLIANVADFMYFVNTAAAAATTNTYFKMTGDVYFPVITADKIALTAKKEDASSRYFVPPAFDGHFDGAGHTIWNPMNGYKGRNSCSTVFGTLNGATVKDLTVKGAFFANIYGNNSSTNAAGLADRLTNGGIVRNCHVVDAFLSGTRVGGLIQNAEGAVTISGCTASGVFAPAGVTNDACFGGIVGYVGNGADITVENCANRMSCELDDKYVEIGGIVGCAKRSTLATKVTIRNCQNYGSYINNTTADATLKGIGGIMGHVYNTVATVMENCQNYGDFTAPNNCGGLIGLIYATGSGEEISMTRCANFGTITATGQNAGGMIGHSIKWAGRYQTAQDCANYGNITAVNCAGGFAGIITSETFVNQSPMAKCLNFANYGDVKANNKFAGLVIGFYSRGSSGSKDTPNIDVANAVLTGSVSADACAGSICGGYSTNNANTGVFINVINSYVDCSITAKERSGAIAGAWLSTDTEVTGSFVNTTGLTLDADGSKFHVTLNGATPANDYFVTTDGVTKGKSASLTALDTAELTNGTALDALNTYAKTNSLSKWVKRTAVPELAIFYRVSVDGANVALNDTMTLKLFVKASSVEGIKGEFSTIMVNDGTKDYEGKFNNETGNYVFEIAGLAAKDMGTTKTYKIKYTLNIDTANPITCSEGVEYSPLQYAVNMYNKNKQNGKVVDTNFAALLTSMVRYMDAAGATNAKSTFATATSYEFGDTTAAYEAIVNKDKDSTYTLTSETAELAAELTSGIILRVKPASGMTLTSVKIGDTALTITSVEGDWRVTGINPGDLYNELTFTFTNSSKETVTATYSIARYLNSYVVSDKTETAVKDLAKATALYMDAFITYKTLG